MKVIGLFFTSGEQDVSQGQWKAQKGAHHSHNSPETFYYGDISYSTLTQHKNALFSGIVEDEPTDDAAVSQSDSDDRECDFSTPKAQSQIWHFL